MAAGATERQAGLDLPGRRPAGSETAGEGQPPPRQGQPQRYQRIQRPDQRHHPQQPFADRTCGQRIVEGIEEGHDRGHLVAPAQNLAAHRVDEDLIIAGRRAARSGQHRHQHRLARHRLQRQRGDRDARIDRRHPGGDLIRSQYRPLPRRPEQRRVQPGVQLVPEDDGTAGQPGQNQKECGGKPRPAMKPDQEAAHHDPVTTGT